MIKKLGTLNPGYLYTKLYSDALSSTDAMQTYHNIQLTCTDVWSGTVTRMTAG